MRQDKQKFIIENEEVGERLDLFLVDKFPEFSRSWVQKLIEKGNVLVGRKKMLKSSYKIKEGETVTFRPELPLEISLEGEESLNSKIKVIHENDNFLIIDKPAGLVVHPSSTTPKGTIVNWLLWKYPNIKKVGDHSTGSGQVNLRPGIAHRLDKETSGLMVVAKNQKTFEWLKKAFFEHKVIKKYLALVMGNIEEDGGEIAYAILRSKSDPTRQTVYKGKNPPRGAKEAKTFWQVTKRFPDYTFVEVAPKTGRMHQIRVHLRSIGHPVAGDGKYGDIKNLGPRHLGRMFLHASFLSFISPKGEKFSFSSPLPEELANALKNLPFMLL